jgi:hypothetical protein
MGVVPVYYNNYGFIVVAIAIVIGFAAKGAAHAFDTSSALATALSITVGGGAAFVADCGLRILKREYGGKWGSMIASGTGGHFFFIPVWVIGLFVCLYGVGTTISTRHKANPTISVDRTPVDKGRIGNSCPADTDIRLERDPAAVTRVRRILQHEIDALRGCDPASENIDLAVTLDPRGSVTDVCVQHAKSGASADCIANHLVRDLGSTTHQALQSVGNADAIRFELTTFHLADHEPSNSDGRSMDLDEYAMTRISRCPVAKYQTQGSRPPRRASAAQRTNAQKALNALVDTASSCRADVDTTSAFEIGILIHNDGSVNELCVTGSAGNLDRLTEDCIAAYVRQLSFPEMPDVKVEHLRLTLPSRSAD